MGKVLIVELNSFGSGEVLRPCHNMASIAQSALSRMRVKSHLTVNYVNLLS